MLQIPESHYKSWQQLVADYRADFRSDDQWVFRGHENANWRLQTTLERQLAKYGISIDHAPAYEQQILRDFLRKVRNYDVTFTPSDALQCASYIQHYGGPTRLMDWTYSFYVAAFFAIAPAAPGTTAAIWCFRTGAWDANPGKVTFFGETAIQAMQQDRSFKDATTHERMFGFPRLMVDTISQLPPQLDAKPCVIQQNSRFLNNRIARQQGIFVVQTVLAKSFEDNLQAMLSASEFNGVIKKLVVECSRELLEEALVDLRRMTISFESLFGNVDYFCRSLGLGLLDRYKLLTDTYGQRLLDSDLELPAANA